jgi:hypothetical protein
LLDGLKSKAVKLLLSIIEGPIDREIIKSVSISMDDFLVVVQRLETVFQSFVENDLSLNPATATLSEMNGCLKKDSFDGDAV